MPAAGAMAKPPSSLDRTELPSPLDRAALLTPLDRKALMSPLDSTALPTPPDRAPLPSPLYCAALSAPLDRDPVREALLRRVEPVAAAWAAQDAELDAEIAALAAAGALTVPAEEERPGPALDPDNAPPDALHAWLADLPGPLLDEYLAVTAEVRARRGCGLGPAAAPRTQEQGSRRMGWPTCCRLVRCWPVWPKTHMLRGWAG